MRARRPPAMEEEEEAAAEICAPKRRRSARLSGQQVSPGGDSGSDSGGGGGSDGQGNLDFVSGLPDEVLGTVISLLPTKDGARTQVLSRRWQPLWLSPMAPLNISANCRLGNNQSCVALVSKILSNHPGPARRFSARIASPWDFRSKVAHWLRSETLTGLQELEVSNMQIKPYPLPPHVLTRFAPTLRVLQLSGCCGFRLRSALPSFPHLKRLILFDVDISEDSLQFVISSCAVLERVSLRDVIFGRLCISSRTLRSIDIHTLGSEGGELVIEDAPCLERLLPDFPKDGPATIRVIEAPKLKILGSLPKHIRVIHCGANHGRGCGA